MEKDSGTQSLLDTMQEQLDRRFREINVLLDAADKLEVERLNAISIEVSGNRKVLEALIAGTRDEIKAVHRQIEIGTEATKTAIDKADVATEKRFESVNEFRAQMADQSALFISRREVEAMYTSNSEKIGGITDRLNRNEGRGMGISQLAGWIFGGVGLLVGLIAIFAWLASMQPKVETNSEFRKQVAPAIQTNP